MASHRISIYLRRLVFASIAASSLLAAEHHGIVKSGGIPVPGATVTATMGDKTVATTTDDNGAYAFPNLENGVWTLSIEMLGFGKVTREIGVSPEAPPAPEWEVKLLNAADMKAAIAAATAPPPATAAPTAPKEADPTAAKPAATPATTTPTAPTTTANGRGGGRNGNAGLGGGRGGNQAQGNGRPSIRQSIQQQGNGNGFQRADVNTTGDAGAAADPNMNMASADLATSSSDALMVNGSVSSGQCRRANSRRTSSPRALLTALATADTQSA